MSVAQRISEAEYERIVLADPSRQWELYDGHLRERPGMTWGHGEIVWLLTRQLALQLDPRQFTLRINAGRARRPPGNIFIPDLIVVPVSYGEEFVDRDDVLAIFSQPLPLVVEVWSRSTGGYDVDAKLPIYQQRGDLEIWRIHPFERTLTTWRRQPDGTYEELVYREGVVQPIALPDVAINLAELFDA